MNILLPLPNLKEAAEEFVRVDRRRANAQIKECCQLLATYQHKTMGYTTMVKKDGSLYGVSHPHHPITRNMLVSLSQLNLVGAYAYALAHYLPNHACSVTLEGLDIRGVPSQHGQLVLCRKDQPHILIDNIEEYSKLSREYMINTKDYHVRA
jgi:hypothetical protein